MLNLFLALNLCLDFCSVQSRASATDKIGIASCGCHDNVLSGKIFNHIFKNKNGLFVSQLIVLQCSSYLNSTRRLVSDIFRHFHRTKITKTQILSF